MNHTIWTRETLRQCLLDLAKEVGRQPTIGDLRNKSLKTHRPSITSFKRVYGSWNEAMFDAGFTPKKRGGGHRRKTIDKILNYTGARVTLPDFGTVEPDGQIICYLVKSGIGSGADLGLGSTTIVKGDYRIGVLTRANVKPIPKPRSRTLILVSSIEVAVQIQASGRSVRDVVFPTKKSQASGIIYELGIID